MLMQLARELGCSNGRDWKSKNGCRFVKLRREGLDLYLFLPECYMNLSGGPVRQFCDYFKIPLSQLLVLHDELDLSAGVLRIKWGGSSAGHRGVEDIAQKFGSKEFYRVRLGIGRPSGLGRGVNPDGAPLAEVGTSAKPPIVKDERVRDWVLNEPRGEELQLLEEGVAEASRAILTLIDQGFEAAQRTFHKR